MSTDVRKLSPDRSLGWILLVIVAVVIFVFLATLALALGSAGNTGYGWMMGGDGGWGWMWGVGALMMTVPLFLLVLLFVVLFRSASPPTLVVPANPPTDPATEARLRYARGEISAEQFRQVLNDLQRS